MAVRHTEIHWEVVTLNDEKHVFYDIEKAMAFRDRHPQANGFTIVSQEVESPSGGTYTNDYERAGLHTTP